MEAVKLEVETELIDSFSISDATIYNLLRETQVGERNIFLNQILTLILKKILVPELNLIWSSDPYWRVPAIADIWGRQRYKKIHQYFHLADSSHQPGRNDEGYDPLYKVRPLLDHIRNVCSIIDIVADRVEFPSQRKESLPALLQVLPTLEILCLRHSSGWHRGIYSGEPANRVIADIHLPSQRKSDANKEQFYRAGGMPNVIGCIDGTHVTSDVPVYGKPYRLPYATRQDLRRDIQEMIDLGIIKESNSPYSEYSSPVEILKKSDGTIKVCVDYRKLNKITVFDPEPMPTAEELS
ncbi:hypothetical protein EGW08_014336 [Elysia chlorotica]|uniref:PiggyBac transposable element-derived protein domain-containing protein n=1 Tax=Elysia chlorotica TaxID=188477 RepID=A0A433T8H4_ELYCH|nr:hypothetical protein EGW08_014336 [Elysia chlorotica]